MLKKKIAWIEDDIDVIGGTVRPLKKEGFVILGYRTYKESLTKIEEIRDCDLILLDLILPSGDALDEDDDEEEYLGKKLLKELRSTYHLEQPVIILSVVAEAPNIFTPEEISTLKILPLSKPIRPSRLRNEVFRLLNLPLLNKV